MSILRFISPGHRSIDEMVSYVCDPQKTSTALTFGLGLNVHFALEELLRAASVWSSGGSTPSYLQIILSFDADVSKKLSLAAIMDIGLKVGHLFCSEHQVLGALHTNTANLHFHFLVNSINIVKGTQFRQKYSLFTYKQAVNQILVFYGLEPIHCFSFS